MAYSYECERDGDKGIQGLFGYVRRTAASPRTVDSPSMTLAQLVRARRGHNLPRQAASFYIAQTDTGPARCRREWCWNLVTRSPAFREYLVRRRGQSVDGWALWRASANHQPCAC